MRAEQSFQTLLLAVLFFVPALLCVRAAGVADPDVWWHMRAGEWMLAHHSVLRVDPFSAPLAGTPCLFYSWLFELLVYKLYHWLGLSGIVAYSTTMVLAITVAMFHLVRRLQRDYSLAVVLSFVTVFSMAGLYSPRPWLFTVLFFIFELDILMHVRKTGEVRELLWLPPIFALWANIHIQFVDGLFVLGLAFAESVAARWRRDAETRVSPQWMGAALVATVLATLANPFGWRIYEVAHDLATQKGVLTKISELQAIPFRDVFDYLILLLALASAAALAWKRRFPIFETALLAFAAILSFRSQRDIWVTATVAAAILASTLVGSKKAVFRLSKFSVAIAVLAAALAVLFGFHKIHGGNAQLETLVEKGLPVQAVQAIQAKGYAGPLYNDYSWGGYLIWAQRLPVSIDGRAAFYGDQRIDRSMSTWNAQPDWASDAQLTSAGVVIGPVKSPLIQLLRMDTHFELVYEDKLAAVFVARR